MRQPFSGENLQCKWCGYYHLENRAARSIWKIIFGLKKFFLLHSQLTERGEIIKLAKYYQLESYCSLTKQWVNHQRTFMEACHFSSLKDEARAVKWRVRSHNSRDFVRGDSGKEWENDNTWWRASTINVMKTNSSISVVYLGVKSLYIFLKPLAV